MYDYECHDYDTDVTTTWLATTSAEAETSYHEAKQDLGQSPSWNFLGDPLPLAEEIQQSEEETSFLLESGRYEDEKPSERSNKSKEYKVVKVPPVACLEDLEIWDG